MSDAKPPRMEMMRPIECDKHRRHERINVLATCTRVDSPSSAAHCDDCCAHAHGCVPIPPMVWRVVGGVPVVVMDHYPA